MSQSLVEEQIFVCEPVIDHQVAKLVGQEILDNQLDPGTWATALSASDGRREDALAAYARIRIQRMSSHQRLRHAKVDSFEARRMTKCFGVKTVQDLLMRSHDGESLNFLKPRLSIISMIILFVGSAGSLGAFGRLLGGILPDSIGGILPMLAMLGGLLAVVTAVTLRMTLPKRVIMLCWNTGLLCACTMVCFGSLFFGVKLVARAAPLESVAKPNAQLSAAIPTTVIDSHAPSVATR